MKISRLAVAVSAAVLLALAGCGGGGGGNDDTSASTATSASESTDDGGSTSAEESESSESTESESSGGGGGGEAQEFCDIFEGIQGRVGEFQGMPTDDQIDEIREIADDIESKAPDEIAEDAANLAKYFRLLADAADGDLSHADELKDATTSFSTSIGNIGVWASSNCT